MLIYKSIEQIENGLPSLPAAGAERQGDVDKQRIQELVAAARRGASSRWSCKNIQSRSESQEVTRLDLELLMATRARATHGGERTARMRARTLQPACGGRTLAAASRLARRRSLSVANEARGRKDGG